MPKSHVLWGDRTDCKILTRTPFAEDPQRRLSNSFEHFTAYSKPSSEAEFSKNEKSSSKNGWNTKKDPETIAVSGSLVDDTGLEPVTPCTSSNSAVLSALGSCHFAKGFSALWHMGNRSVPPVCRTFVVQLQRLQYIRVFPQMRRAPCTLLPMLSVAISGNEIRLWKRLFKSTQTEKISVCVLL